jgi:type IV secretory pathway VirJ component
VTRRCLVSRSAIAGALLLGGLRESAQAATPPGDSTTVLDLPVIEVPAAGSRDSTLAVRLSGDGGWAAGDKSIAAALAHAGIPVVGLDVPSYLAVARTPDGASADLERLLEHYLRSWHAQRIILVGYSHGANIAPFLVSRLPEQLRERLALIALVSLEERASFRFHLADIVADPRHDGDLPVRPEMEKLAGLPIVCLSGEGDRHSLCPSLPPTLARVQSVTGGHRVGGQQGSTVGQLILAAVRH